MRGILKLVATRTVQSTEENRINFVLRSTGRAKNSKICDMKFPFFRVTVYKIGEIRDISKMWKTFSLQH